MAKRKKNSSKMKKIFIALLVLFVSVPTFVYVRLNQHLNSDSSIVISIENNQSVSSILTALNKENILTPSLIMTPAIKLYLKVTNKKMFAGSYKFNPEDTHLDVFKAISIGKQNNLVKVTFPEGITVNTFAKILNNEMNLNENEFIQEANSIDNIKKYQVPINNIEGYLFPETYSFAANQTSKEILNTLLSEQEKLWTADFQTKLSISGMTKHQILTLASIVEAETPVIDERRRIAGVYVNRLNKNMRLEADPTVQYATGQQKRITYADLEINHKYNTYQNYGLPPGPINNPSKTSIEAALTPETHNYLFFVAVGDGSGRHNFSTSFSQHQKYVAQYRRNRKK